MTKDEIQKILSSVLNENITPFGSLTLDDWANMEKKFMCDFCDEFKTFMELMAGYSFPGDILNISTDTTNGNDTIAFAYDYEMDAGNWNPEMIPFYSIGNGDYFCLNISELPNSPVYYFYHDNMRTEHYLASFSAWIYALPTFLE